MKLPEEFFETELPEVIARNVRIQSIGREERLPPAVRHSLADAVSRTQGNTGMRLVFALSYGGRGELVEAARRMLREQEAGRLDPEGVDEKMFAAYLDEPGLPDVDLLIRTGGERRISNFLLWQSAYAELVLSDVLWPDFGRADLEQALADYAGRERRFGRTSAQIQGNGGRP
jgi:undecaprenyl diphosphate synthase